MSAPTRNGRLRNVERGLEVGYALILKGWAPYIPHAFEFLECHAVDNGHPEIPYERWMEQDFLWISKCDAFFYIAPSHGADREKELAIILRKPVYESLDDVPDLGVSNAIVLL